MLKSGIHVIVFVVSSLAILIFGGGYLCGYSVLDKSNCYNVILNDCRGLRVCDPVYMKGYKVGSIKRITLDKEKLNFKVCIKIDRDIKVTNDSYVAITSTLLGNTSVNLIVGRGDMATFEDFLQVKNDGDLINSVAETASTTKNLLKDVKDKKIVDDFSLVIVELKNVINNINSLVADIKHDPKKYLKLF